jgi:hypothetical protein
VSRLTAVAIGLGLAAAAAAGPADVLSAEAVCEQRVCLFAVTLRHADEGWEHYADLWEVLAPDGTLLATRVLAHPHVDEQPFTRRLPGVEVPEGVERVRIRARDSVHGFGGAEVWVAIPQGAPETAG